MPNPKMILLTQEFPYGNSETSFIGPELPFLKHFFNPLSIITLGKGPITFRLAEQITVNTHSEGAKETVKIIYSLRFFFFVFAPWSFNNLQSFIFKN